MNAMLRWMAALLGTVAVSALAAEPAKCKLEQVAEWPVRLQRNLPVIQGSINGKPIGVLLDTGAAVSIITKAAARSMDIPTRATGEMLNGVGGASRIETARVAVLRIGDGKVENMRVRVAGERPIAGVDFILGSDFFQRVDLEIDYAKGVMRLFSPSPECKGASLAFWDAGAQQVPMKGEVHVMVPLKVNGREVDAMVDSGASSSVVSRALASKLGITADSPGSVASHCMAGVGADSVRSWVGMFDTVTIGGETIRDARLRVMDMDDMAHSRGTAPDVILGTDFLRAHHLLISRLQDKLYFSYAGGQVFPATAELECDERTAGKGAKEALAAYDEAIAKNPQDAKALLNRGVLRAGQRDLQGALADLDVVIRLEPANAVALRTRVGVRAALRDFDGALADADAAIANGMRVAPMYVTRANLRIAKADLPGAIAECDEALKLDPRNEVALRTRGRLLFNAGRFDAAEKDFETLADLRQDASDAIWIALSRLRGGREGKSVLEKWLAQAKGEAWPAPIASYLAGRIDRDALLAAAASPDEAKRRPQECLARFFVAENLLASGKGDEARALFEKVRDECPRNTAEREAAAMELAKPK